MLNNSDGQEYISGKILLINKPIGWSSFDVVKKVKHIIQKKYNLKKIKVGHAGTLDPLATGLLILCTGKYTKKIAKIQADYKIYTGELFLGATTPSYDRETKINAQFETKHINKKLLTKTLQKFIGEIDQTPPVFSALKKNGERLYKKARRGDIVQINSRKVFVDYFEITKIDMPKICFKIRCGKGTYIRSIVHDFGKSLKSGAYLTKLCRIAIGEKSLTNAVEVNCLEKF